MRDQRYKEVSERDDRLLGIIEASLARFAKESFEKLDKESLDTIEEGLQNFKAASNDVCALQRLLVGSLYCLDALKMWREKGPIT